jgi:hypothetical protein
MRYRPKPLEVVSAGALLAIFAVQSGGQADKAADAGASGLIARVEALESQARIDRATISKQSKRIATLEEDLKKARTATDEAIADAKSAMTQIKANRKEVYSDIGSIFVPSSVPLANWPFDRSHMHDVLAGQAGYVMGIRNGHRSATDAGSYRIMPKSLQAKCDKIKAE